MKKIIVMFCVFLNAQAIVLADQVPEKKEFSHLQMVVTAKDHFDLAATYREKARYYRKEADAHRAMKEVYRRSAEKSSGSVRESWALMDAHCDAIIELMDRVAGEMDELANLQEKGGRILEAERGR